MTLSESSQPEDAIVEVLDNIPQDSQEGLEWSVEKPDIIEYAGERTPKARVNESRDAIYIFSDVDHDLTRLSADGDQLDSTGPVEIQIWTLESDDVAPRCNEIQNEVIRLLGNLMDDNKDKTEQNNIQPTDKSDHRNESSARRSDHTVMSVTVEVNRRLVIE